MQKNGSSSTLFDKEPKKSLLNSRPFYDPYGTRTRVTAVKGRCLNRLTNGPNMIIKRVTRIELATTAWKAVVLPLNYTRIL